MVILVEGADSRCQVLDVDNELYDEGLELDQELEIILEKFNYAVKENRLDHLQS